MDKEIADKPQDRFRRLSRFFFLCRMSLSLGFQYLISCLDDNNFLLEKRYFIFCCLMTRFFFFKQSSNHIVIFAKALFGSYPLSYITGEKGVTAIRCSLRYSKPKTGYLFFKKFKNVELRPILSIGYQHILCKADPIAKTDLLFNRTLNYNFIKITLLRKLI